MPRIPTYTQNRTSFGRISPSAGAINIPNAPPPVQVRPDAFASAGVQVADELSQVTDKYIEMENEFAKARQVTELNNEQLATLRRITDYEQGLNERNDFAEFENGFNRLIEEIRTDYKDRIKDPVVHQALERDLAKLALKSGVRIRGFARKKEIGFGRASYDNQETTYLNMYATADPETRQDLVSRFQISTAENLATGYLTPEEAETHLTGFYQSADRIRARHALRRAPEKFNPDDYENLTPNDRITLSDHALRLVEARRREKLRLTDAAEKMEADEVKKHQEDTARSMWVRAGKDLTPEEIDSAILNRSLSLTEGKALKKAVDTSLDARKSDPDTFLYLSEDIREHVPGTRARILQSTTLTSADKNRLLDKWHQSRDPEKSHDYQRAVETIKSFVVTQYGPMGQFVKADEIQTYNFAVNRLDLLLDQKDADIWGATAEILQGLGTMEPVKPPLKFGSLDDPKDARNRLFAAEEKGQIDRRAAMIEAGKIEKYLKSLEIYKTRKSIMGQLSEMSRKK